MIHMLHTLLRFQILSVCIKIWHWSVRLEVILKFINRVLSSFSVFSQPKPQEPLKNSALPVCLHAAGCSGITSTRLAHGLWETPLCNKLDNIHSERSTAHLTTSGQRTLFHSSFYRHESCERGNLLRRLLRWQMFMQRFSFATSRLKQTLIKHIHHFWIQLK